MGAAAVSGRYAASGRKRPKHGRGSPNNHREQGQKTLIVYHGTPSVATVKSIRRDGWQIGSGNLHGDGIYFSRDLDEARGYAGAKGVVIKCKVFLGKSATWNPDLDKQYRNWCRNKNIAADTSAKTAFLLKHGYKTLQAGKILVVLKPQFNNHSAWRQKVREIKICSVHEPKSHKRIPRMRRNPRRSVGPACIQPGEHVVVQLRPAWRHYARYYLIPLAGILIFGGNGEASLLWIGITSVMVVCSRYSNLFIITTHRVIEQTGLIARNTSQSCLGDIRLINSKQGILDRLLAVGRVTIESAAFNGKAGDIVFGGVPQPVRIKEMIFRLKYKRPRWRRGKGRRPAKRR